MSPRTGLSGIGRILGTGQGGTMSKDLFSVSEAGVCLCLLRQKRVVGQAGSGLNVRIRKPKPLPPLALLALKSQDFHRCDVLQAWFWPGKPSSFLPPDGIPTSLLYNSITVFPEPARRQLVSRRRGHLRPGGDECGPERKRPGGPHLGARAKESVVGQVCRGQTEMRSAAQKEERDETVDCSGGTGELLVVRLWQ